MGVRTRDNCKAIRIRVQWNVTLYSTVQYLFNIIKLVVITSNYSSLVSACWYTMFFVLFVLSHKMVMFLFSPHLDRATYSWPWENISVSCNAIPETLTVWPENQHKSIFTFYSKLNPKLNVIFDEEKDTLSLVAGQSVAHPYRELKSFELNWEVGGLQANPGYEDLFSCKVSSDDLSQYAIWKESPHNKSCSIHHLWCIKISEQHDGTSNFDLQLVLWQSWGSCLFSTSEGKWQASFASTVLSIDL